MNKEIEKLNRLIAELTADKTHLIQSAMDGGDTYHYIAHDIGYRDLERECKHLQAENKILNRELLIKQVEIDSLNQRIAELEEQLRWIPVSERLPEEGKKVLGHDANYDEVIITSIWVNDIWSSGEITHWMPLPKLPKEGEA